MAVRYGARCSGGLPNERAASAEAGRFMQHQHDHHTSNHTGDVSPEGEAVAPRPPKQEQEQATTDVTEVAPGILRTQLPINMPGLGHVNCYVLEDERGIAVVDPGLPGPESWDNLVDRLGRAGFSVDDVHTVVVTHSHPDHFGGAMRLRHEAGADVVTHESFRTMFDPSDLDDSRIPAALDLNSPDDRADGDGALLLQAHPVGRTPCRASSRVLGTDPRCSVDPRFGLRDTEADRAARRRADDQAGAARMGGDAHARSHLRPSVPVRP